MDYTLTIETGNDYWEVENLFDLSFGPGREGLSSYRLRNQSDPIKNLCFIARDFNNVLAGAIRYWPILIGAKKTTALLLGPIAVHPTRQGEGLGAMLIYHSLKIAHNSGHKRVVLVGDEPYYMRFGFKKADFLEYPPPTNPDRVLSLSLVHDAFKGVSGLIQPNI